MTGRARSLWCLLGFLLGWAIVEVLGSRLLLRYSAFQLVWTRYLVHLSVLLAIFGWRDPGRLLRTRRPTFQIVRSLMMLIMPASWVLASKMQALNVVFGGFWVAPLLIIALSTWLLHERAGWELWLAAAVGGLAAAAVFSGLALPAGAQWLPLLGMAGSFSIYVVMTRSLRHESTRANLFYTALGVFACLTPVMLTTWQMPRLVDVPLFFGVGAIGLITLWMLDRSAAYAPVSETAPLILAQVPFGESLGWIGGNGPLDTRTLVCLAVIGVACSITLFRSLSGFSLSEVK